MMSTSSKLREAQEDIVQFLAHAELSEIDFTERVRDAIEPWNRVGLLDPSSKNRLAHTATK